MSGIAGVWHRDGRPASPEELEVMIARLAHRGGDGRGVWLEGEVGLACELRRVTPESLQESQPARHPAGHAIVFDGRLDCREELLSAIPAGRSLEGAPDPELLLAAFEELGERLFERLNGDFAFALFDARARKLYLVRDPMGVRPLYYTTAGQDFLFASEIKAFLKYPEFRARPSDVDLADLLLANSPLQNRLATCFEGVEAVAPAQLVEVSHQEVGLRTYWDFNGRQPIRLSTFDEYAEAFREHFTRALRRRLRSAWPVAIEVSGGLDSSSLLCLAERLRREAPNALPAIHPFTYEGPVNTSADEIAYVEVIERDYGIRVTRVPPCGGPFGGSQEGIAEFRRFLRHVECPVTDVNLTALLRMFRAIAASGVRMVLTGHWGDQFLYPQDYWIDLLRGFRWKQLARHWREYALWFTDVPAWVYRRRFRLDLVKYTTPPSLLPALRELRARFGGLTRDRAVFGEALRRCARRSRFRPRQPRSAFATVHAAAIYEMARARLYVHSMEWDNKAAAMHGLEYAFPFLDRDLIQFLMNVPGEVVCYDGVPKAILRRAMAGILPTEIQLRRWKSSFGPNLIHNLKADIPLLAGSLRRNCSAILDRYICNSAVEAGLQNLLGVSQVKMEEDVPTLVSALALQFWLEDFFPGTLSAACEHAASRLGAEADSSLIGSQTV